MAAYLTVSKVNRMSLGEALTAQAALTDWDQAHIASHRRMRAAGLGAVSKGPSTSSIIQQVQSSTGAQLQVISVGKSVDSIKAAAAISPRRFSAAVATANKDLARALAPLAPIIDKLIPISPPYYPTFKRDLFVKPVDAMMGLLKPVDGFFYEWVKNSNAASSVRDGGTRRVGIPALNQIPAIDFTMGLATPAWMDSTEVDYFRRLLALANLLVLCVQDHPAWAKGLVKTMVDAARAGGAEVKKLVDELATSIIRLAANNGINFLPDQDKYFKGFSGAVEEASTVYQRALLAVANELLNQMPNLGIFGEIRTIIANAKQGAQEAAEVASFFANYLSYLMGKIGVAIPSYGSVPILNVGSVGFPFDYWAAALSIQAKGSDSDVKWWIGHVRNDMLRPLREKGDIKGWNGPVYNSGLKWLLDMVWTELDEHERKVSDLQGKYSHGGRLTSIDPQYNLVKAAIGYGSPTTFFNPSSQYSRDALKFIRNTVGIPAVVSRLIGDVNETVNKYAGTFPFPRLPTNARLPGLAGVPMDAYTFQGFGDAGIVSGPVGALLAAAGSIGALLLGISSMIATATAAAYAFVKLTYAILSSVQTVQQAKKIPAIDAQPASITVKSGEQAVFTVTAKLVGGEGAPSASDIAYASTEVTRKTADEAPTPPPAGKKSPSSSTTSSTSGQAGRTAASSSSEEKEETTYEPGEETKTSSSDKEGMIFSEDEATLDGIYRELGMYRRRRGSMGAVGDQELLAYQWFKNGVPLPNATSATLNVGTVGMSDSGNKYSVQVSLKADPTVKVDSNVATLTVILKSATEGGKNGAGGGTGKDGGNMETQSKGSILPILLGAGAVAALPVAGPLAALALGAGAVAASLKKKEAPPPAKSGALNGYVGMYGYLGVASRSGSSTDTISQINRTVGTQNLKYVDNEAARRMSERRESLDVARAQAEADAARAAAESSKSDSDLYKKIAIGVGVAGLVVAVAGISSSRSK